MRRGVALGTCRVTLVVSVRIAKSSRCCEEARFFVVCCVVGSHVDGSLWLVPASNPSHQTSLYAHGYGRSI